MATPPILEGTSAGEGAPLRDIPAVETNLVQLRGWPSEFKWGPYPYKFTGTSRAFGGGWKSRDQKKRNR